MRGSGALSHGSDINSTRPHPEHFFRGAMQRRKSRYGRGDDAMLDVASYFEGQSVRVWEDVS